MFIHEQWYGSTYTQKLNPILSYLFGDMTNSKLLSMNAEVYRLEHPINDRLLTSFVIINFTFTTEELPQNIRAQNHQKQGCIMFFKQQLYCFKITTEVM